MSVKPKSLVEKLIKDSKGRNRLVAATSVLALFTVLITVGALTFPAISISGSEEALREQGIDIVTGTEDEVVAPPSDEAPIVAVDAIADAPEAMEAEDTATPFTAEADVSGAEESGEATDAPVDEPSIEETEELARAIEAAEVETEEADIIDVETVEAENTTEEPAEENDYPAFDQTVEIDGVEIIVTAPEGTFPEDSYLYVEAIEDEDFDAINEVVDGERSEDRDVAATLAFDIKILDIFGNELQPAGGNAVKVAFKTDVMSGEELEAQVYHITNEGEVEALDTNTDSDEETASALTDSFSPYVVDVTSQKITSGDSGVIGKNAGNITFPVKVNVINGDIADYAGQFKFRVYRKTASSLVDQTSGAIYTNDANGNVTIDTKVPVSSWLYSNSSYSTKAEYEVQQIAGDNSDIEYDTSALTFTVMKKSTSEVKWETDNNYFNNVNTAVDEELILTINVQAGQGISSLADYKNEIGFRLYWADGQEDPITKTGGPFYINDAGVAEVSLGSVKAFAQSHPGGPYTYKIKPISNNSNITFNNTEASFDLYSSGTSVSGAGSGSFVASITSTSGGGGQAGDINLEVEVKPTPGTKLEAGDIGFRVYWHNGQEDDSTKENGPFYIDANGLASVKLDSVVHFLETHVGGDYLYVIRPAVNEKDFELSKESASYYITVANDRRSLTWESTDVTFYATDPNAAEYEVTSGAYGVWQKNNGGSGLNFIINRKGDEAATFSHFTQSEGKISINGQEISPTYYTAVSGSLDLTLKASLLNTLEAGQYRLTAEFDDGAATTYFTVRDAYQGGTVEGGVSVVVRKTDDSGTNLIGNAVLQIIDNATGSVVDEWVTTAGATHTAKLDPSKTYTLHEAQAPSGYETASDITLGADFFRASATARYEDVHDLFVTPQGGSKTFAFCLNSEKGNYTRAQMYAGLTADVQRVTDYSTVGLSTDTLNKVTHIMKLWKDATQGSYTASSEYNQAAQMAIWHYTNSATFNVETYKTQYKRVTNQAVTQNTINIYNSLIETVEAGGWVYTPSTAFSVAAFAGTYAHYVIAGTTTWVEAQPVIIVDEEPPTYTVTMYDSKKTTFEDKHKLVFNKVKKGTNQRVAGAVLQLLEKDSGKVISTWTTSANSDHEVWVDPSKDYILRELSAPNGYLPIADRIITSAEIRSNTTQTASVKYDNDIIATFSNGQKVKGYCIDFTTGQYPRSWVSAGVVADMETVPNMADLASESRAYSARHITPANMNKIIHILKNWTDGVYVDPNYGTRWTEVAIQYAIWHFANGKSVTEMNNWYTTVAGKAMETEWVDAINMVIDSVNNDPDWVYAPDNNFSVSMLVGDKAIVGNGKSVVPQDAQPIIVVNPPVKTYTIKLEDPTGDTPEPGNAKYKINVLKVEAGKESSGAMLPGATLRLIDVTDNNRVVQEWTTEAGKTYEFDINPEHTYKLVEVTPPSGYKKAEDILITKDQWKAVVNYHGYNKFFATVNGKTYKAFCIDVNTGNYTSSQTGLGIYADMDLIADYNHGLTASSSPNHVPGITAQNMNKILHVLSIWNTGTKSDTLNFATQLAIWHFSNGLDYATYATQYYQAAGERINPAVENAYYAILSEVASDSSWQYSDAKGFSASVYAGGRIYTGDHNYNINGNNSVPAQPVIIVNDDIPTIEVVMTDEKGEVEVEITKYDAETNRPLAGARLQIYSKATGLPVTEAWTSGTDAHKINLPVGEYELREISAPSGYASAQKEDFEITNNDLQKGAKKTVSMYDPPIKDGEYKIGKVDQEGNYVSGAKLRLVDPDGNIVAEWVTDETNNPRTFTSKELTKSGTYKIYETKVPTGYEQPTEEYTSFEVTGSLFGGGNPLAESKTYYVTNDGGALYMHVGIKNGYNNGKPAYCLDYSNEDDRYNTSSRISLGDVTSTTNGLENAKNIALYKKEIAHLVWLGSGDRKAALLADMQKYQRDNDLIHAGVDFNEFDEDDLEEVIAYLIWSYTNGMDADDFGITDDRETKGHAYKTIKKMVDSGVSAPPADCYPYVYYTNGSQPVVEEEYPSVWVINSGSKNVENIVKKISITVKKDWIDKDNKPTTAPVDSVSGTLVRNGVDYEGYSFELNNTNGWSYTFTDLPLLDSDGNKINYSVRETSTNPKYTFVQVSPDGLEAQDGVSEYTFTITNKVVPFEFTLYKIDKRDGIPGNPSAAVSRAALSSTEFTLTKEGVEIAKDTVGSDGKLVFDNLTTGTYILVESETASGYQPVTGAQWTIIVSSSGSISVEAHGNDSVTWKWFEDSLALVIANEVQTYTLPATGGIGTHVFAVIGGLLMLVAGALYVRRAGRQNV